VTAEDEDDNYENGECTNDISTENNDD